MATLPPVPYKTPIVDRTGFMSNVWVGWFRELFVRLGGSNGSSTTEIEADITSLQSSVSALTTRVTVLEGIGIGPNL